MPRAEMDTKTAPSEIISKEIVRLLETRISRLRESIDPIECVAQGRFMSALETVKEAANLLGED